jgi:hypothetical protein
MWMFYVLILFNLHNYEVIQFADEEIGLERSHC